MELHNLTPTEKKRKRIGRGGSRGGTSGRGHKGQRARTSGNVRDGYEGGQMPLYRRLPKSGFNNTQFQEYTVIVGLTKINDAFNDGDEVTKALLIERGVIKTHKGKKSFVVKVLANGQIGKKLVVHAHKFSEAAKQAIESAGGEARVIQE
jgi:large subunit ribosomal protein L15